MVLFVLQQNTVCNMWWVLSGHMLRNSRISEICQMPLINVGSGIYTFICSQLVVCLYCSACDLVTVCCRAVGALKSHRVVSVAAERAHVHPCLFGEYWQYTRGESWYVGEVGDWTVTQYSISVLSVTAYPLNALYQLCIITFSGSDRAIDHVCVCLCECVCVHACVCVRIMSCKLHDLWCRYIVCWTSLTLSRTCSNVTR